MEEDYYSTIRIGYYYTQKNCTEAINMLLNKPGFCDYPDGFIITTVEVQGCKKTSSNEIVKKVYEVTHERILNEQMDSIVTFLGVYASMNLAKEIVEKEKDDMQFSDSQDGFCIDACVIGNIEWRDGFIIYS